MNLPTNLKYAKSHEWVRVEDGIAVVGITDHAQHELTDIVYVETPTIDADVKAGEACAVVESVKAASDIYAPVSGDVTAINEALADQPELVNQDAFGNGWLFKIRMSDPAELDELLSPEDYADEVGA